MAQPSGHDFCYRKPSIGKGCSCAEWADAIAGKPAPTRIAKGPVGAGLPAIQSTADLLRKTNRVQLLIFNWNNPLVF
jgi:hypothetical protein